MNDKESFFRIFDYTTLAHDYFDQGLCYEEVVITKDIETRSGHKLIKGTTYHQVNFNLEEQTFHFINWLPAGLAGRDGVIHPNASSIVILQSELSPFCKW